MASEDTRRGWIDTPAFIHITMHTGFQIKGRFASYTDPMNADAYGAFMAIDRDGACTYVLWSAIAQLQTWPDGSQPSE